MVLPNHRCVVVISTVLLALGGAGCGGGGGSPVTREAKLDGMTVVLTIKSDRDPELTWAVTDRVIGDFSRHHVEVEKNQVTFDTQKKPLPKGVAGVTIDAENGTVTIRADGEPHLGPEIH
jgi:hypothetical protein